MIKVVETFAIATKGPRYDPLIEMRDARCEMRSKNKRNLRHHISVASESRFLTAELCLASSKSNELISLDVSRFLRLDVVDCAISIGLVGSRIEKMKCRSA